MPRTTILPVNDYPTGASTIGPSNIQNGLTVLFVGIARCTEADLTIWPNVATTVNLMAEVATVPNPQESDWVFVSGMSASGGILKGRDGITDVAESTWSVNLPTGSNRKLRVKSVIDGGPLRTSLTVITE
jgi:hypothetical protein